MQLLMKKFNEDLLHEIKIYNYRYGQNAPMTDKLKAIQGIINYVLTGVYATANTNSVFSSGGFIGGIGDNFINLAQANIQ